MINNSKKRILAGKKADQIWEQDPEVLIAQMQSCILLNKEYQACYHLTKE